MTGSNIHLSRLVVRGKGNICLSGEKGNLFVNGQAVILLQNIKFAHLMNSTIIIVFVCEMLLFYLIKNIFIMKYVM